MKQEVYEINLIANVKIIVPNVVKTFGSNVFVYLIPIIISNIPKLNNNKANILFMQSPFLCLERAFGIILTLICDFVKLRLSL